MCNINVIKNKVCEILWDHGKVPYVGIVAGLEMDYYGNISVTDAQLHLALSSLLINGNIIYENNSYEIAPY